MKPLGENYTYAHEVVEFEGNVIFVGNRMVEIFNQQWN